jgi:hypothetical protein
MSDRELLIISIFGILAFFLVMRMVNKWATGKEQEQAIKNRVKIFSIIYGILMTIQLASIISNLLS